VIAQLFFGLLLFATVLGHVANIVTSVSAGRKEFQGESGSNFARVRAGISRPWHGNGSGKGNPNSTSREIRARVTRATNYSSRSDSGALR